MPTVAIHRQTKTMDSPSAPKMNLTMASEGFEHFTTLPPTVYTYRADFVP